MEAALHEVEMTGAEEVEALAWLSARCAAAPDPAEGEAAEHIRALYTTPLYRRSDLGRIMKMAREAAEDLAEIGVQGAGPVLLAMVIDLQRRCVVALEKTNPIYLSDDTLPDPPGNRRGPSWNGPALDLAGARAAQEARLDALLIALAALPPSDDRLAAARCLLSLVRRLEAQDA